MMSFLRKIAFEELWVRGTIASSFCGANLFVYDGIKTREQTRCRDIIVDSIGGFMTGSVVGIFSPVIISAGLFNIPGYIAGKITK